MKDLIERQEAIDVLCVGAELLRRVLDDVDVVGQNRETYSWGLGVIESFINDINEIPTAQPGIIYCKDCKKHNKGSEATYTEEMCPLVLLRGRAQGHEFDYQYCAYGAKKDERKHERLD